MTNKRNGTPKKEILSLKDINDPMAQKISWEPCVIGGANFKTQEIVEDGEVVKIQKTTATLLFSRLMAALGALVIVAGIVFSWYSDALIVAAFALLLGGGFVFTAYYSLKRMPPIVFDGLQKIYFRGHLEPARASDDANNYAEFSDVYSIQLLDKEERISTDDGNSSTTYTCYELNLIFKEGNRSNIMNHSERDEIHKAAHQLAVLLNIPIWQDV